MFIGSINEDLRAVLVGMVPEWQDLPVYVGCSGNFTVERLLSKAGVKEIHSNDVSLYSCAVGSYLVGNTLPIAIVDEHWRWLERWMGPGISPENGPAAIATLLLCSEMFKYSGRNELFHMRMLKAYRDQFPEMHTKTVERVKRALAGCKIADFFAGDVMDYVRMAPTDSVFITFPPTYKSGYERLYKKIDAVFSWERPEYQIFDEDGFRQLTQEIESKKVWVTLRDHEVEGMDEWLRARIQTGMRNKPVFVYGVSGDATVVSPHQKLEPVHVRRLQGELKGPPRLMEISQGQLNTLRSEYLNPKIVPASAAVRFAIVCGDELIGALAFDRSTYLGGWCEAYMMTDFAIPSPIYKRLSKLVLATAVSTDVRAMLEMSMNRQIRKIGTTAFTHRPVSQKYRGVFDLYSRKPGALNYVANAGRWSMQEGYEWWQRTHNPIIQTNSVA